MYRNDMEALRARINTLDAQLVAERRARDAAEANALASRAALEEQQRFTTSHEDLSPAHALRAWPVVMVVALSTVSCLFLGMQWSHQWHRGERLERMLVLSRYGHLRGVGHHRGVGHLRGVGRMQIKQAPLPVRIQGPLVRPAATPTSAPAVAPQVAVVPQVKETLLQAVFRLQRQSRRAFQSCLEHDADFMSGKARVRARVKLGAVKLRAKASPQGRGERRLNFRIQVRADGTVGRITATGTVTSTRTGSKSLGECAQTIIQRWRFPASASGEERVISIPLVFRTF
ncbi:MAG: hypothetical protein KAI47_25885 [Deltaproteobacteria bacterium]|nr:hypothetical protein [Deltaproteobacteria bacterium]